jgi:protein-tyrosine-phosphatase
MAEVGIDIAANRPKVLTPDAIRAADVIITMGCGDTCPVFPGKRDEDWPVADLAGQDRGGPRDQGRDRRRVAALVSGLLPEG